MQTVYGAQEAKQRIIIALQHFWQEYWLDLPSGMPWYSGVTSSGQPYEGLLGGKSQSLADAVIRQTILDVPNVLSIVSLQFTFPDHASRAVSLAAVVEVLGISGPEIINIEDELILAKQGA